MRIVVDAMGGDTAPKRIVEGALMALAESQNRFEITFVGIQEQIEAELKSLSDRFDLKALHYDIVHTPDVIDMHDHAASSVKAKPNSSIVRGLMLHKEKKADGFVSAGSTGAVMAASLLVLGRIGGVLRPTIGAYFPNQRGHVMIFDVGANVDSKPEHLVQFAQMGSIYMKLNFGLASPTVGLLNVGEEDTKGNEASKEAHKLLKAAHEAGTLNFIGNVEGRDVLKGIANVVVCDGFVGNILLKFGESVPSFLKSRFKLFAEKSTINKLMMGMLINPLRTIFKDMDADQFGGVPLLGLQGISIIGHGSTTVTGAKNMIYRAEEMALKNINEKIRQEFAPVKA
jgi:glycerol-3-phosphate acyltransferase PlsX